MRVRQPRDKLASSSSGCQTRLLASSACWQARPVPRLLCGGTSLLGQASLSERSLMASCLNEGFSFSHLLLFFSTVAPSSRLFEGSVLLLKACPLLTQSLAQLPSRCASRG